ncbi:MAG: enoyl-CoA hydratase/isomerase family protein [Rhizobiaceae bacterium]|nr:enoyl-CoA hydratase/isomerase family protein [Rhizobiaceae bacterium]
MSETLVLIRDEGGVRHLTLNRPQVRNAMSLALLEELVGALDDAEKSDAVRIIVVRGSDGTFSAGADIKDMANARNADDPAKAIHQLSSAFGAMVARFATTPKTVITALEGAVMGGGFGLACASDIAIASHTVKFALPEATLGLIPAQIAPVLLERIGYSEAKRLTVTGARIGAEEAMRIGLVHAVTDDMDTALKQAVEHALTCAPHAVAISKKLLRDARFVQSDTLVEHAANLFVDAVTGEEGAEGTLAFVEKRKARWMP